MYRYLRPALAAVPHVGLETQPSLEDIVLLKPDLIVASRFRHQRIAPLLEQIGTVLMLEEVFEFKRTLAMMGAALQRQQLAMDLLGQWQQRVAALRGQLQAKFAGRWPITVSVLDIREDHIRSYLPASFAGSVLSELGFAWTSAAREATGVSLKLSSKESLPVVDADLFFVFQRADSNAAQHTYDKLVQNPFWQQLRAVQDHRYGALMPWPGVCPAAFWAPIACLMRSPAWPWRIAPHDGCGKTGPGAVDTGSVHGIESGHRGHTDIARCHCAKRLAG